MTGILSNLFEKRYKVSQTPPGEWLKYFGMETASGVDVNSDTAMTYSAVYACVRILAETTGMLPLPVYKRLQPRGKEKATSHYLYSILHDAPNEFMTSMEFRETLQGHLALWGNAYAEIEWTKGGKVAALWPLRPDRMTVEVIDHAPVYTYQPTDGEAVVMMAKNVLHLRGLGSMGISGYSIVSQARQTIGLGLATEEFGARFFGNGAVPGGVLMHPKQLTDPAHKRMKSDWEDAHKGLERAQRIAILEEGVTYKEIGVPPEDAQFLQTRRFQVEEIARWFRIPPHMLADLERATFSNIEELGLEFVTYTLNPWLVKWEQRLSASLLTPKDRQVYFIEHLVNGLLRGDITKRYQAYATGKQWGWLSTNDIREMENLNPVESGDIYLQPLNMVEAGSDPYAVDASSDAPVSESDTRETQKRVETRAKEERAKQSARSRHRLANTYARLYRDSLSRVLRREADQLRSGAKKFNSPTSFLGWLDDFYAEHKHFIHRQLQSTAQSYSEMVLLEVEKELGMDLDDDTSRFVMAYLASYAGRHAGMSEEQLRKAIAEMGDRSLDEVIDEAVSSWETDRAERIGQEEAVRANNAFAVAMYGAAGVELIRSVAFGESCPYCSALDGKVVGINQYFLEAGKDFQPDGAEQPLNVSNNMRHSPYHAGCDCMTIAER